VKTPIVCGEVNCAATHLFSVLDGLHRRSWFCFRLAKRDGLDLEIVGQSGLERVLDLVVGEILFSKVGTLLQHDNREAGSGKLFRENTAGSTRPDDEEVDRIGIIEVNSVHSPDPCDCAS
jgi:hypothetical protein